ncbi:Fe-S cluster assembly protein SufD [Bauldia sp.]|uniref:Fe-S cluster assembly protein SufD n=1 Tax=Bauldia sp. TaxID=2575872 RepID=UPI003BA87AAB
MTADTRPRRTEAEEEIASAYVASRKRFPGDGRVRAARDAAFSHFEHAGLPNRRVEAWKYTDLRAQMRSFAPLAPDTESHVGTASDPIGALDRARAIIANGRYRPEQSDLAGLDGVTVEALSDVLASAPERVGRLFDDGDDVVMALNTALMLGGVVVTVAPDARPSRPLELVYRTIGDTPITVASRAVVSVGANASVRMVESHAGPDGLAYQVNTLTELDMDHGARVAWARVQVESEAAQHLGSFVARMGRDTTLNHLSVNRGAALARWQAAVHVGGSGASAGFSAATMLSETEHSDNSLVVRHTAPHSVSNELFKNVVDDQATGAFQGMIAVDQEAQKTDAKMMTQALLLSNEAQFASKPELEIFADDVRCGHGATAGEIDPSMLFYLMSRGLPPAEAERLLIEAFLDDAIDALGDDAIGDALKGIVAGWLARRGAVA